MSSSPLTAADPAPLPTVLIEPVVRAALLEDLGRAGDVTASLIPAGTRLSCAFVARKDGRLSGLDCARVAVALMDPEAAFRPERADGADVKRGDVLARVEGDARAILTAERTALNLMSRLCGTATLTRTFVQAVAGTSARICETRKTTPGLRALEKYAVRCGGGFNHRFGLDDAILIKDNHVAACGSVSEALRRAKASVGHLMPIQVEVDSLAQLEEALPFQPTAILLDNFSVEDTRRAVEMTRKRTPLESSGGVNLETVRGFADAGVDVISVGALTHSAPILDIGLDAL